MQRAMQVSFVRVPGERDRIYVHRTDGSETSWVFPSYGSELPHDLVHLVVETAFGLRMGFWGRVDAGVDPARVNAEANRKGGPDKYRGFGSDRVEILVAEGLAAAPWFNPDATGADCVAAIEQSCASLGYPRPALLSEARVAEVRSVLHRLRERWRGIHGKCSLVLQFHSSNPAAGFDEWIQSRSLS